MSIKMKELPEMERPYEKLEMHGEKTLSNAELLAIIIKSGTKEETSVQLAQKILNLDGNENEGLNFLSNLSIEEFMQIKGIGKVKAIQLKAVCELSKRMIIPSSYKRLQVKQPYDLAKVLMEELRFQKTEIVKVAVLNNKNEVLKIKDITLGGTNFVSLETKDIIVEPLKMNAQKIILVHNHPTGDPTPSDRDIEFTMKLYDTCEMIGIQLMDHLVIGDMKYISIFSQMVAKDKDNIGVKGKENKNV